MSIVETKQEKAYMMMKGSHLLSLIPILENFYALLWDICNIFIYCEWVL